MKTENGVSKLRPLTADELELVAGGDTEGQEVVVTARKLSQDGGGGGGYGSFGGFPSYSGMQSTFGGGGYSVTYWDTDAMVTEHYDANGNFTSLEADYAELEPLPADDATLFVSAGIGLGYFNVGSAFSPYGIYPYAGYGSPGPAFSVGYTNSNDGYLTGYGASGNSPAFVGGGISENGQYYAVTVGTPGYAATEGYYFSDVVIGLGGYVDRFIMAN